MSHTHGAATSLAVIRSIFFNAPVGVLIVARSSARILFANAVIEQMLGYDPSGLDGVAVDDVLPASVKDRHAQLMAGFFADPRQRTMGSGRDLYAAHRDGREVPVEIALAPMRVDGESCAIAYVTDLTDRHKALRQREQLIAAMPQGVLLIDATGKILLTNPALNEQFGYAQDELTGQAMDVLLPERYRSGHAGHLLSYLAHPVRRKMGTGRDLTGLHKTGVEFPVEIALCALELGPVKQLMAVVSDISVRKKAEHALRQINAQLEEFTYVVSHDLRSPLRGIADLLSWIQEDLSEAAQTPSIKNNFERIEIRITRCERMIDDLLDYARAGRSDAPSKPTDISVLVAELLEDLAVPAAFVVECDIHTEVFLAPPVPLSLSLRNLIANAVKHHGAGQGRIRISAKDEGRFAVITVEDDGEGIPEGAEERIFKLFHRANSKTEGYGVGLAVARRMINAYGGTIMVGRSPSLGGACFRISWPRVVMKEVDDE